MADAGPVSTAQLAKVARRDWNTAIAAIAARQHGLVTLAQLATLGMSPSAVRRRASTGSLHRVHRGVFAVGNPRLRAPAVYLAAVLACGPGSVVSHFSAAAHAGIRESASAVVDITCSGRGGRRPGIRRHRADTLCAEDVAILDGVPCTTVARTILDLAVVLREGPLEHAIHQAQAGRLISLQQITEALARAGNRRGTAKVRRILGLQLPGEEDIKSRLERRMLRICRRAGLPPPAVNRWIALTAGQGLEVDFCWEAERLVVETDSATWHRTARAAQNDPRRDRQLTLAGWRVARFTYRDVTETPGDVARELRDLLRG